MERVATKIEIDQQCALSLDSAEREGEVGRGKRLSFVRESAGDQEDLTLEIAGDLHYAIGEHAISLKEEMKVLLFFATQRLCENHLPVDSGGIQFSRREAFESVTEIRGPELFGGHRSWGFNFP
jgi:hypothetical protein